ncbi:dihydroorotate dehydrogenase electron transfer subunit [Chloroflexota bacterium]
MRQVVATVISNEKLWGEFSFHGRRKHLSTWLMWLSCARVASEAKPGQFVMVNCGEECLLPRPFSIHQVNDDSIALFYAVLVEGKGTRWLSQRRADDKISLLGPLGNGFIKSPTSHNLLLVAGGNGIAPLYFLAQEALKRKYSVTLLYGTVDKERYPISPQIKLVSATEDGTIGHSGKVTDLLTEFVGRADQIFACGPMAMYLDMVLKKQELKLTGKSIQISLEIRMGCGRGVCYGCTIKTKNGLKQVCQDGPVFDLDDILWDELDLAPK